MTKQIAPSMMCADIGRLEETLRAFEQAQIDYLHLDIMDGDFVPNFALGTDYCRRLYALTDIPMDYHLMISRPETRLDWFPLHKGDIVSIHSESTVHVQRVMATIRQRGARPLLALNPATPLSAAEYVLDDIDGLLIMTVNPGFAGQPMVEATLRKIAEARALLDAHGRRDAVVEVDGNVSFANARRMSDAGADLFVAGSSSVFSADASLTCQIERLRAAIA